MVYQPVFCCFLEKLQKKSPKNQGDIIKLAASPGLEPRLTESESAVLPLDDEAIIFKQRAIIKTIFFTCQILLQKILHFYKIYATLQNRRKNYG